MASGKQKRGAFGETVTGYLARDGKSQSELAAATGRSRSYVNHTLAARKHASPQWVDLVAKTLDLQAHERANLMRAAAIDAGFELDLSK